MGFLQGTKLEILRVLGRGPRHGYAIARELKLTLSTVYEHLKELKGAGLVASEPRGRRVENRLTARGKALVDALGPRTPSSGRRT